MKLPEFFTALDAHPIDVPMDILVQHLETLELPRCDCEDRIIFDPEHYRRNLLRLGDGYAALVLCWRPGQASAIHDHRGSACAVKVIQGEATETRYVRSDDGLLTVSGVSEYPEGSVCGSYDADIHVLENRGQGDLVTLHVYTPPLQSVRTFRLDSPEIGTWTDEEALEAMAKRSGVLR